MPAELGFTMIELIVACVLVGMVVALAASSIMRGFAGTAETATSSGARAKAAEAAERIGADIRGARSTGRDGAHIADTADLVRAVRTDGPLHDIDGNLLDWRDVTLAEPNALTFQSDVVDEAASSTSRPECVTWSVGSTPSGWYVRRVTKAWADRCAGGGTGAPLEDDELTPPTRHLPAPGTRGVPPLFAYVVARQVGDRCQTSVVSSRPLASAERNRVVGVRVDFSSVVVHRGEASRAALHDEISIRSRSAADYQLALGCDEG